MSAQSSRSFPPPPLNYGSVNVRSLQVAKSTKTFEKVVVPLLTGDEANIAAGVIPAATASDSPAPRESNDVNATAGQVAFITAIATAVGAAGATYESGVAGQEFATINKLHFFNGTSWEVVTSA